MSQYYTPRKCLHCYNFKISESDELCNKFVYEINKLPKCCITCRYFECYSSEEHDAKCSKHFNCDYPLDCCSDWEEDW